MESVKKILGIITARGGSERLPGKNKKDFLGKPLFVWSIEAGVKSGVFDRFILSTDSQEIAEAGKKNGIAVPFLRPARYATSTASSHDALKHALVWMRKNEQYEPDWVVLLEPTAPGRSVKHIRDFTKLINAQGNAIDSIISVSLSPAEFSPERAIVLDARNRARGYGGTSINEMLKKRKQDVAKTYFINSGLYAFKASNVLSDSLWGDRVLGYVMDRKYAIDIDISDDWIKAEAKMKLLLARYA